MGNFAMAPFVVFTAMASCIVFFRSSSDNWITSAQERVDPNFRLSVDAWLLQCSRRKTEPNPESLSV